MYKVKVNFAILSFCNKRGLDLIKLDFVLDTVMDVCRSQVALETNLVNSVTALESIHMAH